MKKQGVNKNVVARISHIESKDVLLNNQCLRHLMNRIKIKNHKIETCESNKISLSCFDDKICMLNDGYDGLAHCY